MYGLRISILGLNTFASEHASNKRVQAPLRPFPRQTSSTLLLTDSAMADWLTLLVARLRDASRMSAGVVGVSMQDPPLTHNLPIILPGAAAW